MRHVDHHQPQNEGERDQQKSTKSQVDLAWIDLIGKVLILVWVTILSFIVWDEVNSAKQLSEERCEVVLKSFQILGEELEAPQERIDAFVARVEAELDCNGPGVLEQ